MPLPRHLFVSEIDGALYDTRQPNWHKGPPLRAIYDRHFPAISSATELKACLRAGATTGIGGYPLYFITADGGALSFKTVLENLREVIDAIRRQDRRGGWCVVACEVNYENEIRDDHTGEPIPAAYRDD